MDNLQRIAEDAAACQACSLHDPTEWLVAKQHLAVAGRGPAPAEVMVIGEAPGIQEADSGEEFVGSSGKLLDLLFGLTSLTRPECFVTNVVKHRPPRNRNPKVSELRACAPLLDRQLALVRPKVVIALGLIAAKTFDKKVKMANDHGRARRVERNGVEYFLIPMYHPAAALRDAEKWAVMAGDFARLDLELEICKAATELPPTSYRLVDDPTAAQLALSSTPLGFDLETTSPRRGKYFAVQEADIIGYSVSWAPSQAVYVEGHPELVSEALSSPIYQVICHNTKFELGRLRAIGIPLERWEDTKIAAWLLQYHSSHLKALTRQLLGRDPITYEQVSAGRDLGEVDPTEDPLLVEYGAADSDNTLLIWPRLERELKGAGLWRLYEEVEKPIVPILVEMEAVGVLVDEGEARQILSALEGALEDARLAVYQDGGLPEAYDVGSTDQMAEFFEESGAPMTERTDAKQQLRVNEDALLKLAETGWRPELVQTILHFRSMRKTRAYAEQYLELRGPDGRLHPDFVQAGGAGEEKSDTGSEGPVTGRFACRGPNLQNQPKRKGGEWVARLRRCIIPTPGWKLIAGDISQEEVRIAAHVIPDRRMLADVESDTPVYAGFAESIYGRPIDKHADPMEWNIAKQCVLSFIWGTAGKKSWAPRLVELDQEQGSGKLTLKETEKAYDRVEKAYPDVVYWRRRVWKTVYEKGEVRDIFGRRRLIPKAYHPDRKVKAEGHREAMNFLIQGPASTVMKMAMIRVSQQLKVAGLQAHILLTVHDEIVCECPEEEVDSVARILYSMTNSLLPIVLPVEVAVGNNWGEMREYEV